jgi:hypothetical protein
MNRRRFVVASLLALTLAAAGVTGLALYSNYAVKAAIVGLPEALDYMPATTRAVFGMNVTKFVASPAYAKLEARQGKSIADDLADFIAKTGVDPRRDLHYLIAGGSGPIGRGSAGLAIAVGSFNTAGITTYINGKTTPIKVDYRGSTVLMFDEGRTVDKGIAFLSEKEIAVGDLESLKAMLDVRAHAAPGIMSNTAIEPLLHGLDPEEMFWFAGDTAEILSKAPQDAKLGATLQSLRDITGTLNIGDAVTGKVTLTAADEESARKVADVARGFVALGQLAGDYDARVADLLKGVSVTQDRNRIRVSLNFALDLLERLEQSPPRLPNKAI